MAAYREERPSDLKELRLETENRFTPFRIMLQCTLVSRTRGCTLCTAAQSRDRACHESGPRLSSASLWCCAVSGARDLNGKRYAYADFFFAFGLVAFGTGCGSGLPSIEDKRPAVNV
ncbi:hypothetical protein SAMN05216338_102923 [Bradyrhizobium sp. Rc2d]|nr:hypothetical protein SAMN05216338_102923 [Bradyrhizobium sp. Rc2d]